MAHSTPHAQLPHLEGDLLTFMPARNRAIVLPGQERQPFFGSKAETVSLEDVVAVTWPEDIRSGADDALLGTIKIFYLRTPDACFSVVNSPRIPGRGCLLAEILPRLRKQGAVLKTRKASRPISRDQLPEASARYLRHTGWAKMIVTAAFLSTIAAFYAAPLYATGPNKELNIIMAYSIATIGLISVGLILLLPKNETGVDSRCTLEGDEIIVAGSHTCQVIPLSAIIYVYLVPGHRRSSMVFYLTDGRTVVAEPGSLTKREIERRVAELWSKGEKAKESRGSLGFISRRHLETKNT